MKASKTFQAKNQATDTLTTNTLFWLLWVHGTRVACGTHQTSVESPLTFKNLSHLPPTLEFRRRRHKCQVCVNIRGDSLHHLGVCCKSFASQMLPKVFEEMEITGPMTCDMIRHNSWEVMDNPLVTWYGTTAGRLRTIRLLHDTSLRVGGYGQYACDILRHYGWEVMDNTLVTWYGTTAGRLRTIRPKDPTSVALTL